MTLPQRIQPVRIQLRRTRGWRLQEVSRALNGLPAVKVDRTTRYGNPFTRETARKARQCECNTCLAARYQIVLYALPPEKKAEIIAELSNKNLACWCSLEHDCHAAVLLEFIANNGEPPAHPADGAE